MANNTDAIDLMNENQRLRDVNTKLVEALERLHYSVFDPYDNTDGRIHFCRDCRREWPCPTNKALAAAKASESPAQRRQRIGREYVEILREMGARPETIATAEGAVLAIEAAAKASEEGK